MPCGALARLTSAALFVGVIPSVLADPVTRVQVPPPVLIVGAQVSDVNGLYFPSSTTRFKYVQEPRRNAPKQQFLEGFQLAEDRAVWSIGDAHGNEMHYVAVVPTLDRPPLGHFRHWPADAPDQNLFVIPVDLAVSSSWTEHIITANASLRRHQTGRPLLPKGGVVAQVDSAGSTRRADDSPRLAVVEQAGGMAHLSPKDLWPCPIVLPMWSRGFAAACCDVAPQQFYFIQGWGEVGLPYQYLNDALVHVHESVANAASNQRQGHAELEPSELSASSIYVASLDMPRFVNEIWPRIPKTHRVVLVTAQEDIGVPLELWEGSSRNASPTVWNGTAGGYNFEVPLMEFLSDVRLSHWFVQNLDIDRCGYYTCPPGYSRSGGSLDKPDPSSIELQRLARRKTTPLPIGIDFHSLGETFGLIAPCHQQVVLDEIRSQAVPFLQRRPAVVLAFGTSGKGIIQDELFPDRVAAHNAFYRAEAEFRSRTMPHDGANGVQPVLRLPATNRNEFWSVVAEHKFVAVAQGHGMDTHRFWEVLALGSVPVVASSPLDRLYKQFPCIILPNWDAVSPLDSRAKAWTHLIVERFGAEPFSPRIQHRLSTGYWTGLVDAEVAAAVRNFR